MFLKANSLRNTEIHDMSFTEEDIKENLSNLNEHSFAGPETWNAKFLKLCKSSLAILIKILLRRLLDSIQIP